MEKKALPQSAFSFLAWAIAIFCGIEIPALCADGTMTSTSKTLARKSASKARKDQQDRIRRGKEIFLANGCFDCHRVAGKGSDDGVALDGIAQRRAKSFLQEHLKDPEEHVAHNFKEFGGDPNLMTSPNLSKSEIDAVVAYLLSLPADPALKLHKKHK